MRVRSFLSLKFLLFVTTSASVLAQSRPIDPANSRIVVHVSKAGLFSALGDNHEVEAPISEGSVDDKNGTVAFTIETARMRVVDPQLEPDKRQQVQERMLGPDVLDVAHFPKISFESTRTTPSANAQLTVTGRLFIRGVTRPITLRVRSETGRYLGTCTIKQRDFGITPVTVAGGTVKVKDELKIDFDVHTREVTANNFSLSQTLRPLSVLLLHFQE